MTLTIRMLKDLQEYQEEQAALEPVPYYAEEGVDPVEALVDALDD